MHTVWKGAISFGLVHIPVKMHAATEDRDIHFRQLHKSCGLPIKYEKICPHCNTAVVGEDIVKGFEYEKDKFMMIKEEELEAIKPESARTLQILDFVDLSEIDPIYFEKTYYLSPDQQGSSAYNLLREAINQTQKIGIAKINIRGKSNLAAVRCIEHSLVMETMRYPDEIRSIDQVPNLSTPDQVKIDQRELDMAKLLVEQLSTPFDAAKYTNEYRDALLALIEQKRSGLSPEEITATPSGGSHKVVDLMAALQASLQAVKMPTDSGGTGGTTGKTDKPSRSAGRKKAKAT